MRRLGITEVFTPKTYPQEVSFRYASVAANEEKALSIPTEDLAILDSTDWYGRPSQQAWEIANKYFDAAFFIFYSTDFFANICNKFEGAVIWRIYGRTSDLNYSKILEIYTKGTHRKAIATAGRRFWFGEAYSHLHEIEAEYLQKRSIFLPLGLANSEIHDKWTGNLEKIYFVCPDISVHSSYKSYYDDFIKEFSGLPYAIGGTQGLPVDDPNVLGYLPEEQHLANMSGFRVMFYHSTEPNHIHYHPFEAIRAGMPLVFMAGGMLDRMGGINLPGRCANHQEARKKLEKILNGDQELIHKIRTTQAALLQDMQIDRLEPAWRIGLSKIREELALCRQESLVRPVFTKPRRIALIIPERLTHALMEKAKYVAKALHQGSKLSENHLELVILYPDKNESFVVQPTNETPPNTKFRPYSWKSIGSAEALRAMEYSGFADWQPEHNLYSIVDDGIAQLNDCDLWLLLSDSLDNPMLPMRPTALLADRIEWGNTQEANTQERLSAIRSINRFIVTTEAAYRDVSQNIGVNPKRISRVPALLPIPKLERSTEGSLRKKYFVWATEALTTQNSWIIEALRTYYSELGGKTNCSIVIQAPSISYSKSISALEKLLHKRNGDKILHKKISVAYQKPGQELDRLISHADLLLVPEPYSADTYDLLGWGQAGQRLLTYKDASLIEFENNLKLRFDWLERYDSTSLAIRLKELDEPSKDLAETAQKTSESSVSFDGNQIASTYWRMIRECL